jgi:hypothetical protein
VVGRVLGIPALCHRNGEVYRQRRDAQEDDENDGGKQHHGAVLGFTNPLRSFMQPPTGVAIIIWAQTQCDVGTRGSPGLFCPCAISTFL